MAQFDDEIMGRDQVVVLRVRGPKGEELKDELGDGGPQTMSAGVTRSAYDAAKAQQPVFETRIGDEVLDDRNVQAKARPMALMLIAPVSPSDPRVDGPNALFNAVQQAKADKITWGIRAIGADKTPMTGRGVKVAVLDTGIKRDHPAFNDDKLKIVERDYTDGPVKEGDGVANDEVGHGTHCAGTIFGRDVGGVRIGVAPGVTDVLIAKVIGGRAATKELLEAMDGALSWGANVISMSLGFDHGRYYLWLRQQNVAEQAALSQTLNVHRDNIRMFDATMMKFASLAQGLRQHTLVVAASGNEANRPSYTVTKSSPAAAIGVLSVGAVEQFEDVYTVAPFSNADPDIVGPGVAIVSAGIGDEPLVALSGTSMACPHIAGLAALRWQSLKEGGMAQITSEMMRGQILQSAFNRRNTLFPEGLQIDYGMGLPSIN